MTWHRAVRRRAGAGAGKGRREGGCRPTHLHDDLLLEVEAREGHGKHREDREPQVEGAAARSGAVLDVARHAAVDEHDGDVRGEGRRPDRSVWAGGEGLGLRGRSTRRRRPGRALTAQKATVHVHTEDDCVGCAGARPDEELEHVCRARKRRTRMRQTHMKPHSHTFAPVISNLRRGDTR